MKRKIKVADLLCGAGGSSTGAYRALKKLGLEMDLVCVNHWPTAIETHTINHPEARHYVEDISTVRPHILVPEGYLDLLMASPTCTHHSVARGGKPTSDQQRSDPWHIITWLTELRVKRIIIENVWEFTGWGPVNLKTGRPIQSRKGEYFHAWIDTLKRLGFQLEWRKLNAADYGDATTRQRFILMGRSDGRKINWPMPTHQKRDGNSSDLFNDKQSWRPAREIIDWDIKGKSIFNRKKPLAPKTLARIHAGAVKHNWPEPFIVVLRNHMAAQGIDMPIPTIAANGQHIALAEPVVVNMKGKSTASSIDAPLPTQTSHAPHLYAAEPVISAAPGSFAIEPFVLSQASGGSPRSVSEPIPTAPCGGAHALITSYYGMSSTAADTTEPLPTVTTKDRFGIVVPVTHSQAGNNGRSLADPIPTITTAKGGEFAVVLPVTHEGGLERSLNPSIDPLPTVTGANRGELAVAEAFGGYDILFRMLEPHELAAAMGFNTEEYTYEFAGTKTEKIKQIGNAVSVAKMEACVGAIMADDAPRVVANDNQETTIANAA